MPDGNYVKKVIKESSQIIDSQKWYIDNPPSLEKIKENCGVKIYNLGTGKGSSVLDVVHAYEKACGKKIPYEIKPRRAGDLDELYSQCDKAEKELHWTAKYDLNDMCADSWKWQSMNPNGYND